MYLWVVIAIFISALAALSTSLRPDAKDLYINTQAETEVTQIYTLHKAVLQYIDHNRTVEGVISLNSLNGYLPFGFLADNFSSISYCLNSDGINIPNNCQTTEPVDASELPADGCGVTHHCPGVPEYHQDSEGHWYTVSSDASCCTLSGTTHYVITYGEIPQRWRNIYTGKPREELLSAMKDKVGYVDGLGYAIKRANNTTYPGADLTSGMVVVTQGTVPYSSIPQYVINTNDDFNSGGKCDGDGNYCLVYISKIAH